MSKLFRKLTVVFVLVSLVFSQTGLVYLGSFLSPKEASAGVGWFESPMFGVSDSFPNFSVMALRHRIVLTYAFTPDYNVNSEGA